jgi:N-acetyl-gamma-glutamyl-phosphate reductase
MGVKKLEEAINFQKDKPLLKYTLILLIDIVEKMKDSLNIGIAGATGYVGLELIKILSNHSKVKIIYLFAKRSVGKKINTFDKKIIKKSLPRISKLENIDWNKIDLLFTALPNGEAHKIARIMPSGIKL